MVEVVTSPSESARFGRRVARVALHDETEVAMLCSQVAVDEHDLVIVRYPARWVRAFDQLSSVVGRAAIYADTLLYFRWDDDGRELAPTRPSVTRDSIDAAIVPATVSGIFSDYVNHYVANPRLDRSLVAIGYAEWAASVAADESNVLIANHVDGDIAGLAVIDSRGDDWDVVLAGVSPEHRGGGVYGDLMLSVMQHARTANRPAVLISTQSHNVQVMRTWERLGWRITSATITVHLQRER